MNKMTVSPYMRETFIAMTQLDETLADFLTPEVANQIRNGSLDDKLSEALEGSNDTMVKAMEIAGITPLQSAKALYTYGTMMGLGRTKE